MKKQIIIVFLFLCFCLFGIIYLENIRDKKPICPQYYDILYKPNGDILCVAPDLPPKFHNPPVYDPKILRKNK